MWTLLILLAIAAVIWFLFNGSRNSSVKSSQDSGQDAVRHDAAARSIDGDAAHQVSDAKRDLAGSARHPSSEGITAPASSQGAGVAGSTSTTGGANAEHESSSGTGTESNSGKESASGKESTSSSGAVAAGVAGAGLAAAGVSKDRTQQSSNNGAAAGSDSSNEIREMIKILNLRRDDASRLGVSKDEFDALWSRHGEGVGAEVSARIKSQLERMLS